MGQLDLPVEAGVEYQVTTSFVVNMNGIMGGGGEAMFIVESLVPDTVDVEPDPSAIEPDTALSR